MGSNLRLLKAFVRLDSQGRVVAGSLIFRKKMPKVGKWLEINAFTCCNPTTTTTTTVDPNAQFECVTYLASIERGESGSVTYNDCFDVETTIELTGPSTQTFCSAPGDYNVVGNVVISIVGECEQTTTTTTTTVAPTTTTTTTTGG